MANRRAPEAGYDFGNKRQYRRIVWNTFRRFWGPTRGTVNALLMPSLEGDEVKVALAAGFRERHLHVVDRNPAIVAHLKRRFPKVNTYGVEACEALARMAKRGVELGCANFDFCSCMSGRLYTDLCFMAQLPVWGDDAVVAVTVLRGRERGKVMPSFKKLEEHFGVLDHDVARLGFIGAALGGVPDETPCILNDVELLRRGSYRSVAGHQTMLWGIYHVDPIEGDPIPASELPVGYFNKLVEPRFST